MSTITPMRPLDDIVTTEAHVRVAHENYSRTVPDLCGRLNEDETSVSFLLFVPELGQVLTYRAQRLGGVA